MNMDLPACYLMVGFGARAAYETDITTMAVWACPLLPDGTLGAMEEFRTGSEPDAGLEMQYVVAANRALTGAGLRTLSGNVAGIYAESCALKAETVTMGQDGIELE